MNLKIRNFGAISNADIKLDGITVICGNNNTGKSTVGKALFGFYNSLYDYKNKILSEKMDKARNLIINYSGSFEDVITFDRNNDLLRHEGIFTFDEVKKYFDSVLSVKITDDKIMSLVNYFNSSEEDIINEYVFRIFNNVMNGQAKNSLSSDECIITAELKGHKNTITIGNTTCDCIIEEPIEHTAYYINNPFSLDWLNQGSLSLRGMNILERNVISAILKNQADINEDSMTNILDSVKNKNELDKVREIIKKAYSGDTMINHGKYFYVENGTPFDFRNISAGLKSFALIERMLETGVLKKKDILILDEPEIHLHSEWQIYYAELIVLLQKYFDLTIFLVTHSSQFLESLDFFMKKYEISDKGNYYIPELIDKGFIMKSCANNPYELRKVLTTGSVTLSDLKFKYEMENYREEEENKI